MVRLLADGALRYLSVTLSIALPDATSKYHANQSKARPFLSLTVPSCTIRGRRKPAAEDQAE